jgi:hypothetical protein
MYSGKGDGVGTVEKVVSGAVAVFLTDLMAAVHTLHVHQGAETRDLLKSCANRLLQTNKSRELEALVATVLLGGTPCEGPLLDSVLAYYRLEHSALVPTIMDTVPPRLSEAEARQFVQEINATTPLVPSTPFQHLVCGAISRLYK